MPATVFICLAKFWDKMKEEKGGVNMRAEKGLGGVPRSH